MNNWPKIELGELCEFIKGETGIAKANPGPYPLVTTGAERKTCDTYQFNTKAVCLPTISSAGHGKRSLNYIHYQEGKFALGTILVALIPKDEHQLNAKYLHTYLFHYKDLLIVPLQKGAANVSLPIKEVKKVKIPVPPLTEQLKLINLLQNIDSNYSNILFENENQIVLLKQLRQAILQEAVEGKLTAEWRKQHPELISGENHAARLLEKIKAEKALRQAQGTKGTKRLKELPPISEDEKPFDLPEGWVWTRLGDVINIKSGKRIHASDYKKTGIPFLRSGEIGILGRGDLISNPLYISEEKYNGIKNKYGIPKPGDILIACIGGSIGNTWVVDDRRFYFKDGNLVLLESIEEINTQFLLSYLSSPFFINNTIKNATDSSYNALTIIKLNYSFFPLPPFPDQQTIVKKVDRLMAKIDALEEQVKERKAQAEQLMQAVLREAFNGEE